MNTPETRHIFDESGCINQQMLMAYQRNQLSRTDKHSIEQHLVDCELCSEALEGLALIGNDSVLNEVNERVKGLTKNPVKPFLSPRNKNYLLMAASVTIVAVSTYFVLNFTNSADKSIAALKMQHETEATTDQNSFVPESKNEQPTAVVTDSVVPNQAAKSSNAKIQMEPEKKSAADSKPVTITSSNAGTYTFSNQVTVPKLATAEVENKEPNGTNGKQAGQALQSSVPAAMARAFESDFPIDKYEDSNQLKSQLKVQNITFLNDLAVYNYPEKVADEQMKNDIAAEKALESPYETREEKEKDQKEALAKSKRVISYKEKLSSGLSALKNKEYQNALRIFDDLLQENDHDVNALFYSGLTNENMNHYTRAIELYNKAESVTETDYFVEAARWHRANCLIQLSETDEAKVILNSLKINNGFYSRQATDRLKKLK